MAPEEFAHGRPRSPAPGTSHSTVALVLLVAAVVFPAHAAAAVPLARPNVIFFIADDVSWNDLGCYGNTAARTPNIDRLAANGRRFDAAFLTASSCSPSRSSIVTGRYPHNNGHDYEAHGRAVRSEGYLYLLNHRPTLSWQGPADSVRSPSHQALRAARDTGQLSPAQADVFLAPRPSEELYHTASDPDQLKNLAADPRHRAAKVRLAKSLADWTEATGDTVPEKLSRDSFDRETGKALKVDKDGFRGTPAGSERLAARVNAPGPR